MLSKLLVSLALAGTLCAQSQQLPLPAFASTYQDPSGTRGFYFQTPVDITIVGLRVPDEQANGTQNVEVIALGGAPPAYPATATGGQVFYANNVPSGYVIPCRLNFAAGSWIGVLGACGTSTMLNSYGSGPFATTIGGQPATLTRFLTQTNLNAAGGQPYSGSAGGSIARVEVHYTTPAQPVPAALPAFGSTYTGYTRGFYFQTPVPIIIRGLRVPDEARQGVQTVEVSRAATPPPAWSSTQLQQQVFYAHNQPSYEIIPCFIPFQAGDWVTVLGMCNGRNSYASVAGPFTSSIGGVPTTFARCGTQFDIGATGGNNPIWSEDAARLARVEVYYEVATGLAESLDFGPGCVRESRSFYDLMSAGTFDLGGGAMRLDLVGNRYVASPGGAYVPPTGAAQLLALGDDVEGSFALTGGAFPYPGGNAASLVVCSNGFVSVGGSNGTGYSPNVSSWLNSPNPRWGTWHDFNATRTGSGRVKFEQVGAVAYVTWDGVYDYSGLAQPNTWQLQFDLHTGRVTYVWPSIANQGNSYLVGFAGGGGTVDAGPVDVSAQLAGGFATSNIDYNGLRLTGVGRPVIGSSMSLQTSGIPLGSVFGAELYGFAGFNPGLPLASLGAPGCAQYTDGGLATLLFFVGGSTNTTPFNVPNNPFLLGVHLFAQSATLTPGVNALGVAFSNGTRLKFDLN